VAETLLGLTTGRWKEVSLSGSQFSLTWPCRSNIFLVEHDLCGYGQCCIGSHQIPFLGSFLVQRNGHGLDHAIGDQHSPTDIQNDRERYSATGFHAGKQLLE